MSLIQMSFSGAIMILAVIVVRALAINKLPKRIFMILWEAVLFRLLIPFSIPSMLSAYTFVSRKAPVQDTLAGIPAESIIPQAAKRALDMNVDTVEVMLNDMPRFSIWPVLWIAGMILCTVFFVVSYLRCYFEFRTSVPVHNEAVFKWLGEHPLRRTLQIRQSDRISAPLTYGILKPVILMPQKTDWENTQQLQYVLLHEYMHIRRLDMVWKLTAVCALCIHWFNPMVWVMYILFNRDIELSCDERVVRQFGETSKSAYAMTLITMEEKKSGLMPLCNNFSKNAIEERITSIMKVKRVTIWALMVSVSVLVAVVVLFATSAAKELTPYSDSKGSVEEGMEVPGLPGDEIFTNDLEQKLTDMDITNGDSADQEPAANVREREMRIPYDVAGDTGEMAATLYVGDGFSIYIPDEGWMVYDESLDAPWLMAAVYSSSIQVSVAHYVDEKVQDVIARLLSEGYVYDANSEKFQKLEGVMEEDLLHVQRLYGQDNDVWVVYSCHLAAYEWGSRLDAIADTFAVTVNDGEGAPSREPEAVPQISGGARELENIMTSVYTAYFEGDADTIKQYLVEDYQWHLDVYEDPEHSDEVEIRGIKGLDRINEQSGENQYTLWLEFLTLNEDSLTYLTVEFVKENGSWKVNGYGLEK